jgi:hypothetical protein
VRHYNGAFVVSFTRMTTALANQSNPSVPKIFDRTVLTPEVWSARDGRLYKWTPDPADAKTEAEGSCLGFHEILGIQMSRDNVYLGVVLRRDDENLIFRTKADGVIKNDQLMMQQTAKSLIHELMNLYTNYGSLQTNPGYVTAYLGDPAKCTPDIKGNRYPATFTRLRFLQGSSGCDLELPRYGRWNNDLESCQDYIAQLQQSFGIRPSFAVPVADVTESTGTQEVSPDTEEM